MISLKAQRNTLENTKADVVVTFTFEDKKLFKTQMRKLKGVFKNSPAPHESASFAGKEQEILLLFPDNIRSRKLLLVGLGKSEKFNLEKIRRAAAAAAKAARNEKAKTIALVEPDANVLAKLQGDINRGGWESIGTALGEGAALGLYKFDKYLSGENKKDAAVKELLVVSEDAKRVRQIGSGLRLARVLCEATYLARDLENAPGNEIFPATLARRTMEIGRKAKFKVRVFNERKIGQLKMGGLLAVSQGSEKPARFIILEYNAHSRNLPTVVLVGKGVTFDAGGISIKPAAGMAEMKMDMSGAAAVIGTMQASARLKLPLHIVGLIPATENLLGGGAVKPGDILTHYNGKTSEVDNTDAEGRLILADALSYASRYQPDLVIDLATLTGACVVALGHFATGMMGNDDAIMRRLKASGERTYERVWELPMFDEYEKLIKSDVADVKNVGGRWAGAITAAMFLRKFIGDYKWVHLDIAGTAILEESLDYIPKGGSGVGVRLMTDFLRHWNHSKE